MHFWIFHHYEGMPVPQAGTIYLGRGWFMDFDFPNRWRWSRMLNLKILELQERMYKK